MTGSPDRPGKYRTRAGTYPGIAERLAKARSEPTTLTADLILRYAYYRSQGHPALAALNAARRRK